MQRIAITFRELLERILPLDQPSPTELARVREALAHESPGELERLAYQLLERLGRHGLVRRLPDRPEPNARVLRFQLPDSLEIIALRYDAPPLPSGLVVHPRALLAAHATAPTAKLRPLLALEQSLIGENNRLASSRPEMIQELQRAATALLDGGSAAFFPAAGDGGEALGGFEPPEGEAALLAPWTADAVLGRDLVLVCPDAAACPPLAAAAAARGFGALAALRIRSRATGVTGFLEVRAPAAGFFDAGRLALLDLLGDSFEATLVHASRLERIAYVDPMTGIFNRSFFHRELAGEVARARREAKPFALCIGDIDDFKRFNTEFGYEAGNQVLIEIARLLRMGLRPFDSVARWGGEEFALLLSPPVDREDAEAITQRLQTTLSCLRVQVMGLDHYEHSVQVTMSLGVSLFPSDADTPEELWRLANQALLVAKRPPKNQTVFWSALAGQ